MGCEGHEASEEELRLIVRNMECVLEHLHEVVGSQAVVVTTLDNTDHNT